jgi:hypothetical protein
VLNGLGNIAARFTLDISDLTTNMRLAEERIQAAETRFSGFTDIGSRISGVGQNITMGVTLPIVGAGVAIGKMYTEFEDGMAKIKTVADTSKISLDQIGDSVKKLSDDSGLGTADLQAGLYDVLSAGVKTEDSIKYLSVAVKSAKGGFTDTATAVDGLTSTLNAYGKQSSEAEDIANQMMVAQNLGRHTCSVTGKLVA